MRFYTDHLLLQHFPLYLFLLLVPCCEPPPDLGAEIPGNHRRSPARPAEGTDHSFWKAALLREYFYFGLFFSLFIISVTVRKCS